MLELMRKHARNWLMKVLLGMVIIVFIFYFGSMRLSQKAEAIVVIDNKAISYMDFQKEYYSLLDFYRQRYGRNLTDDFLKSLNLKQLALNNLINQAVMLQKAAEFNVEATDEEVRAFILSNQAFQRDGVFDEKIYSQVLRYNKISPADFEDSQKKLLTMAKMENLIREAAKVSDKEAFDLYRFQNEKINVKYLVLPVRNFKDNVNTDRKNLEAFLKEHEDEFRVPDRVQVKYLSFAGKDFSGSVKVSDAEALDYYNSHKDKFAKKGSKPVPFSEVKNKIIYEINHIQGMYAAAESAKKAREVIYQKENFDEYAKLNGLKVNTTELFTAKNIPVEFRLIKDFAATVFALPVDEISSVLSDNEGYYLLKVVARKPSHVPAVGEIEGEVAKRYVDVESKKLCKGEAETILDRLRKGYALEAIAREKGLSLGETGLFVPGAAVPKIGVSQELSGAILEISEKNPYPNYAAYVNGNYVIVKFKERGKLDTGDFESKKAALKTILLNVKKSEYLLSWIERTKESMIKEGTLKIMKKPEDI